MRRFGFGLTLAGLVVAAAGCGGAGTRPIPRGFRPETAAAVGTRDYWVLGEYRCSGKWCLALARSVDGGRHFARIAVPPFPSQGTVATLVFANARDGFAYVKGGSRLYATHDGGLTWQRTGPGGVLGLATGGGDAYAIFRGNHLERSPVSTSAWRRLALPVDLRWLVSVAARGSKVWLLATPRGALTGVSDRLVRSADGGATFSTSLAPCVPGLAGTLVPAGKGVVWAVCPTGMMAGLWLSTNGGLSFPSFRSFRDPGAVRSPPLTNGARIFPLSPRDALLDGGGDDPLLRSTDGGRRWTEVRLPFRIVRLDWLGFTTRRAGLALVQTRRKPVAELWRTTDGGATWHDVPMR